MFSFILSFHSLFYFYTLEFEITSKLTLFVIHEMFNIVLLVISFIHSFHASTYFFTVKSDRAWDSSDRAQDRCRNSCFSSFHSFSYSFTVRWIELLTHSLQHTKGKAFLGQVKCSVMTATS